MQNTQSEYEQIEPGSINKREYNVIRYNGVCCLDSVHYLINEEPLTIRVDGQPYMVLMRTPGEEECLAAGFCLSEGIIDDIREVEDIAFNADGDTAAIDIRLRPERSNRVRPLLEKTRLLNKSSSGMSGKVTSNDTSWNIMPSNDDKGIPIDRVIQAGEGLSRGQKLYPVTRGAHAVMILNRDLDILSIAEDVGRHNAIDKAIGKVLVSGKLSGAFMGVLSSRVSMEMLQKANRANIPFLLSGSRPTSLAVDMGKSLNMTLACLTSDSELIIFAGEERILR